MPSRQENPYGSSDMMTMTRHAQQRVQEMRERARALAQGTELPPPPPPVRETRNWSTDTGRQRIPPQQEEPAMPEIPGYAPPPPEIPAAPLPQEAQFAPPPPPIDPNAPKTTIIEDVLSAVGVEEDTLLILGLILILINQKADTTLILALAYLLI